MRTVTTTARVNESGVLTAQMPAALEPGEYQVAIVVNGEQAVEDGDVWPVRLIPLRLDAWPAGSTFGRDELYDDDGR